VFGVKSVAFTACVLLILFAASCSESAEHSNNSTIISPAYVPVSAADCAETGINGEWLLIYFTQQGKHITPDKTEKLVVSNCRNATYFQNGVQSKTDTFRTFRVIRYCADYQLIYNHDSISCINFRHDTMIIGACNDYEDIRFFYKRK
jgi:hypothetical protein